MTASLPKNPDDLNSLDRLSFLRILHAARQTSAFQFSKQACLLWLANYPGDLFVRYHQALSYEGLKKTDQAISICESLIQSDPTFIEPLKVLERLDPSPSKKTYYAYLINYLTQKNPENLQAVGWLQPMQEARTAYHNADYESAIHYIHEALIENPPSPIPAILHLKTIFKTKQFDILNNLSEIYHKNWPLCLQINLLKALSEMESASESTAVEHLHWIAAHDSAGQVIQKLLGQQHRFSSLWPQTMEISFDLPIPARVNAVLGWNQLSSGTGASEMLGRSSSDPSPRSESQPKLQTSVTSSRKAQTSKPEPRQDWATQKDFEEIQKIFSRYAKRLKKPDLERTDNRFPVYVILSARKQLQSVYGPNTAEVIDNLLKKLVNEIRQVPEWGALLFYPDDPAQMAHLGLNPVATTDAWQIKLSLADLDQGLANQGEMIGALLLVGGPEIIPFHHLPNPTGDDDPDVPSDNPYATIDENYFIPQWPVGRLPGDFGSDAGLLLSQIRNLIYQYENKSKKSFNNRFSLQALLQWFMNLFNQLENAVEKKKNIGYSAEIWRESSQAVFETFDRAKNIWLTPPEDARSIPLNTGGPPALGYFNLHGVKDGPNWYGQKGYDSSSSGPDYPIALRPSQFSEAIRSPELVFSEACYGAHITGKKTREAISLKCLDSGTQVFIGSTCIAYGSIMEPLIAADFLARSFWNNIIQGYAAGYALLRAKLSLAQEMTRIQGFLDGEDQKTLLSFVLYGDPLATFENIPAIPKPLFRPKQHPFVKAISDSDLTTFPDKDILPREVRKKVKRLVQRYLPGLNNAQMSINTSIAKSFSSSEIPTDPSNLVQGRYIVTLRKTYQTRKDSIHLNIARMTFDKKGKLLKLTNSR